jgi:hypothetical protein
VTGIPSHLFNSLREALADCEQFETNRSLRAVFVHEHLKPWQNTLPQADTLTSRVDAVISFLHEKHRRDGSNALVLLLRVLSSQIDPEDEHHHRLATLADELESALGGGPPASSLTHKTDPTGSSMSDRLNWKQSCRVLNRPSTNLRVSAIRV